MAILVLLAGAPAGAQTASGYVARDGVMEFGVRLQLEQIDTFWELWKDDAEGQVRLGPVSPGPDGTAGRLVAILPAAPIPVTMGNGETTEVLGRMISVRFDCGQRRMMATSETQLARAGVARQEIDSPQWRGEAALPSVEAELLAHQCQR